MQKLALCLTLLGTLTAHAAAATDVDALLDRLTRCIPLGGEPPTDPKMQTAMRTALEENRCDQIDADEAALRKKYAKNPAILKRLEAAQVAPGPALDPAFNDFVGTWTRDERTEKVAVKSYLRVNASDTAGIVSVAVETGGRVACYFQGTARASGKRLLVGSPDQAGCTFTLVRTKSGLGIAAASEGCAKLCHGGSIEGSFPNRAR